MKKFGIAAVLFLVVVISQLTGCCGGGTSTRIETQTSTTTVGEQMIDLQKAYESGAITEREYKKAKQDILDKVEK
jgi:uncharacterized membrane protein